MINKVKYTGIPVGAALQLDGSKSISNRALLIQALSGQHFELPGLSTSEDVQAMQGALLDRRSLVDVGPAGTTFRFLCALLSVQPGRQTVLTGSSRMLERPVGPLVDGLRQLGANISYEAQDGFPPLKILGQELEGGKVSIRSDISSQFVSALMMLGPKLKNGLEIELTGQLVSYSYLQLTKSIMQHFGASIEEFTNESGNLCFKLAHQAYQSLALTVEADWSAASYYYAVVALSDHNEICLKGLQANSFQGDSALIEMGTLLGLESRFTENGLSIRKVSAPSVELFDWDYSNCPDIAQTLAVICTGLSLPARFTGVETLKRKETDRTAALATELQKMNVRFYEEDGAWLLDPSNANFHQPIQVATYHDHRMAMAFAPLCMKLPSIIIEDPKVVGKSYTNFWKDLSQIGFSIETTS